MKVLTDIHTDDKTLVGYTSSTEPNPKLGVYVSRASGNKLQRTDEGLFVGSTEPVKYYLTKGDVIEIEDNQTAERRTMVVQDRLFIISLSFKAKTNGRHVIFRLPDNSPTSLNLASGSIGQGLVWLDKNSREIICNNVTPNIQVSIQLIGFTQG